jgi:hypothetical protein
MARAIELLFNAFATWTDLCAFDKFPSANPQLAPTSRQVHTEEPESTIFSS